mgnify:CR=1 FL=1
MKKVFVLLKLTDFIVTASSTVGSSFDSVGKWYSNDNKCDFVVVAIDCWSRLDLFPTECVSFGLPIEFLFGFVSPLDITFYREYQND